MLRRESALLLVIDVQSVLFPKREGAVQRLLGNTIKLIQAAQTLELPIVVTEQNPGKLGSTYDSVAEVLADAPRWAKMEFGCLANEGIAGALRKSGRTQLLIVGMETHICVMQTALEALDAGYEVFVARDAVTSVSEEEYEAGLARMAQAGVTLVTTQMALFELLRAAGTPEFRKMLPLLK